MAINPPLTKKKKASVSDEQDRILRHYQKQGLVGTGRKHHDLLARAVLETGLPEKVVRKRVYNMKRRPTSSNRHVCTVSFTRGLSGYNCFCQAMGSMSQISEQRHSLWGAMWAELSGEEKEKYREEARRRNSTPLSELTASDKKAAMKTYLKKIREYLTLLDQLEGCNGLFVFSDGTGFSNSTCGTGDKVLAEMLELIHFHLNESTESQVPVPNSPLSHQLRKTAAAKVREAYGLFLCAGGPRTFPYTKYLSGQTNLQVLGLPVGFAFKNPSDMLIGELQTFVDSSLSFAMDEGNDQANISSPEESLPSTSSGTTEVANQPQGIPVVTMLTATPETSQSAAAEVSSPNLSIASTSLESHSNIQVHDEELRADISPGLGQAGITPTQEVSSSDTSEIPVQPAVLNDEVDEMEDDHHEEDEYSPNESIQTVPHTSNEDAMWVVQQRARAIERNRLDQRLSRPTKGFLQGLLGTFIWHLWELTGDGTPKGWYKGTVVKKNKQQFALTFPEDGEIITITAKRVKHEFEVGTMYFDD